MRKYNSVLVSLVEGNLQLGHIFSYLDVLDTSFFDIFYEIQNFRGTFLFDILFEP